MRILILAASMAAIPMAAFAQAPPALDPVSYTHLTLPTTPYV